MTRTTVLMTAAVSALGLMLAAGGAMAQGTDTKAKARQIVVEAKAEAPVKAEIVAKAEAPAAVEEKVAVEAPAKAEAPANDTATLTDDDKALVAKAIEEAKTVEPKKEEPAVKVVVEEPAPVLKKKKLTSKVVFVERNGEMLKVRKYSNGTYKILGYAENYYQPSYSSYNSGGYGDNCQNGY
ncbi:MAG: hypothetical protein AB7S41_07360 [Parvibaculaceae bacterium]